MLLTPQHNLVYLGWYSSQISFYLFYLDLISTKKYVLGSSYVPGTVLDTDENNETVNMILRISQSI